jgi:DNA-binding HxlR family transcriptional regulator
VVQWTEFDSQTCSIARTLDVLGDRWTMLVLRNVFNGVRRFDDLQRHLGVARDVLAKRLSALVEAGVLVRAPYRQPGERTRYEYRLTDAGRELRPALLALMDWGDRYRPVGAGPPAVLTHEECGAPVHVTLQCAEGHVIGSRDRLRLEPGPGARRLA